MGLPLSPKLFLSPALLVFESLVVGHGIQYARFGGERARGGVLVGNPVRLAISGESDDDQPGWSMFSRCCGLR